MHQMLPQKNPAHVVTTADLQKRLDTRTKPPGSLGRLETLAIRIGLARSVGAPAIHSTAHHGVRGRSRHRARGRECLPQEVTAQMVLNYLSGGAAINVLARQLGLALAVIDSGVASTARCCSGSRGLQRLPAERATTCTSPR